jgi:O-antigen/teichoic acid export membrane protein
VSGATEGAANPEPGPPALESATRRALRDGMLWLGAGGVATHAIDALSGVAILYLLGPAELGVATLAWSLAVVLEAFNGFGVGLAIVQAPELRRSQLDGVWWYTLGIALLLAAAVALVAPAVSVALAAPELRGLLVVSVLKLPLVGAALVPLQLLNRELRFREIAGLQASATLLTALLRVGLAAAGWGAWALVWAHAVHGLLTLAGALVLKPFRPRPRLALAEIRPLVRFGATAASASVIYHFYRNADYLVVERFFGREALGLYRAAFDLAMSPVLAVLTVANRAAFPVFARHADDRGQLRASFLWTVRVVGLLTAPIAVFLAFAAPDLLAWLAGGRWAGAAPSLQVLAAAAVLRSLAQLFPRLFHACGRPGLALVDAVLSCLVLCTAFVVGASTWGARWGEASVALGWLAAYPLLLAVLVALARRVAGLHPREWAAALAPAAGLALLASLACAAALHLAGPGLRPGVPTLVVLLVVSAAGGLSLLVHRRASGPLH